MIGTVTLNPCVDRTVSVDGFIYGGLNRVKEVRRDASGKGIDVSLALAGTGHQVRTAGFLHRETAAFFTEELRKKGIAYEGVEVAGRVRENVKVFNTVDHVTTEENASGEKVDPEDTARFLAFYEDFLSGLSSIVLAGSVPPGTSRDIYRRLCEKARRGGVWCVLDADGDLLEEGVKGHPSLIKPNDAEFSSVWGFHPETPEGFSDAASSLVKKGVADEVCVTLGKDGAVLVSRNGAWYAPPVEVPVLSTQGAGDAMVAGLTAAHDAGKDEKEMLAWGTAMALGTVTKAGTEMCGKEDFARYLRRVEVRKL